MELLKEINAVIWSPALEVLLVLAGLYFSIGTRFVQFRRLRTMLRILRPSRTGKDGISSFQAFCLSLSGRVGTGNIVGVATAIAIGGPGAVFWMWVVAILGASTAFVEATLAQLYKFKHDGIWRGGPFSYISEGLGCKPLAFLFAGVVVFGSGLFCTTVQANGMASAFSYSFGAGQLWSGIVMAALVALVVVGGARRIAAFAGLVTPFMAIGYVAITLVVLVCNWRGIPSALASIVTNAFGINPICGGVLGSTILMGVKRGLFSNEAGMGTVAIPSASAEVNHPAEQGLAQSFSVYVDTLLVCTATALMLLTTGCYNVIDSTTGSLLVSNVPELGNNYVAFTQSAADTVFRGFGSPFICISLAFFAFTTIVAYYFYSESSLVFMLRRHPRASKAAVNCFKMFFLAAIVFGAGKEADLVWALGDIGTGTMAWINVICILLLSPHAFRSLKDYERK